MRNYLLAAGAAVMAGVLGTAAAVPAQAAALAPGTVTAGPSVRHAYGTAGAKGRAADHARVRYRHRAAGLAASGDLSTVTSLVLHGGYTSAGIGMRDLGYGTISISGVPAGATVKSAYLLWDVLADQAEPAFAQGTLDGSPITGTEWAAGASPCWPVAANFSYEANVTSLVSGNGSYSLAGFATGDSTGADPWNGGPPVPPLLEGASLVVIYHLAAMPKTSIQIGEGATETNGGSAATATLSGFTATASPSATTTFIVADGQAPGNTGQFDGQTLPGVSFPGGAPQAVPNYSLGNLWDNVTADASSFVTPGATSVTAAVTGGLDCLVWVGQVLAITTEGPTVTSVQPTVTPLNGGTALTVKGTGFGPAGSADTVQFCETGGGGCVAGTGVSVLSGTMLHVTTPDATALLPPGAENFMADTVVTDPHGLSSAAVSADQVQFGCDQATLPDGRYEIGGCFTEEDHGKLDVTEQQSNLDGLVVSAAPTDPASYADGAVQGHSLTSASSTMSLNLGGTLIPILQGPVNAALTQPITIAIPQGTQVAGLTISGSLTISPGHGGTATGTVAVTLPPVLGGVQGTLTFTTTVNAGLTKLKISVPQASFMQLFTVSKLTLGFTAPGTWTVSGKASTGGTTSTPFSGSLVYSGNTLTSASLSVGKISIAGLFDITQLGVSYSNGAWSGTATITQKGSGGNQTATIALGFSPSGTLTSASITAANIALFGVFPVASFSMSYTSGTWALQVMVTPAGPSFSASLTVTNGVITAGSISMQNVTFQKVLTVENASVSYAQSAPNSGCPAVQGTEIWCGSWQVQLPQTSPVNGVSGALAIADGKFASASLTVSGQVPLLYGVSLTSLNAGLTVNPPPTTITGGATLTFGPQIGSQSLLALSGQLTRTFPVATAPGTYRADGALSSPVAAPILGGNGTLGTASVQVPDNAASAKIKLSLGSSPAAGLSITAAGITVQVTGSLVGVIQGTDSFSINGKTGLAVNGTSLANGSMKVDSYGMAACASTSVWGVKGKAGFEYVWATGQLTTYGRLGGCSEQGF